MIQTLMSGLYAPYRLLNQWLSLPGRPDLAAPRRDAHQTLLEIRMTTALRTFAALSLAGIGLGMIGAAPAAAQTPKVFFACYVPSSGAVYRIKEPNTPSTCGTSTKKGQTLVHVEFSWTDGAGAVGGDHGALAGLGDDDHPQYLLSEGTRISNAGFALLKTGSGVIPADGPGTRLMWYPARGVLRAGGVQSDQWDEQSIGLFSTAFGWNSVASGDYSFAAGVASTATGARSVALGGGNATGSHAVAIGQSTSATGDYSVALGAFVSTNGKTGAFVFGDRSSSIGVQAQADNQFVVRAQQFWLGTNNTVTATAGRFIETSTGAYLSSGGTWTNSSDSAKKAGFRDVDGDEVLTKIGAMPIRTWSYRSEDSTVRHMGPTAQDFRAAFGLGDGEKAIATVDADGVSLAAVQALVRRLGQLEAQVAELQVRISEAGGRR